MELALFAFQDNKSRARVRAERVEYKSAMTTPVASGSAGAKMPNRFVKATTTRRTVNRTRLSILLWPGRTVQP